ncbi:hypothetical protein JJV70_04260 [Streptomyces sp. JJ66]|uniref:hypothetical protein n=1 Tax=Streptomyces sp. JJ66 TaxID=2803843 RepID=UPI001C587AB8|nr:hypothetical protein [Streptomyces sp. JJ66]MBW1601328.1 hypothetical protein [Streptomyces sp. JJ66]
MEYTHSNNEEASRVAAKEAVKDLLEMNGVAWEELARLVTWQVDETLKTAGNAAAFLGNNQVGNTFDAIENSLDQGDTNESVNASSQALYWSTQLAKVDLSAVTTAFDVFKIDETGISVAGVKVWTPPYIPALEDRITRRRLDHNLRRAEGRSERFLRDQSEANHAQGEATRNKYRLRVSGHIRKISILEKRIERLSRTLA